MLRLPDLSEGQHLTERPSWGVVTTAFEVPDATVFFAAYHIALGAASVSVYLDNPKDPAKERLLALPGCKVIACNDRYWNSGGRNGRPVDHTFRQRRNANHAYRRTSCDWLFHIDIDELIYPFRSLTDELAALPDDLEALRVVPLERMAHRDDVPETIYDGSFVRRLWEPDDLQLFGAPNRLTRALRRVRRKRVGQRLYGKMVSATSFGHSGHASGKAATRKNSGLSLHIHGPIDWSDRAYKPRMKWSESTALLHFEGLTRLQWVFKRLRAIEKVRLNPELNFAHSMRGQVALMRRGDPVQVAFELYRRLCTVDSAGLKLMRDHDLVADVALDLSEPQGLAGSLDLSPGAVDDWLWRHHGETLDRYGLRP